MSSHAVLAVAKTRVMRLTQGGKDHDRDSARALNEALHAEHQARVKADKAAREAWEAEREAYLARCVIEERQEKVSSGGLRKTTVVYDELRLPDGQVVRCDPGEADSAANARFSKQHPGPEATADATAPPPFDTWWNQEAKEVRAWSAAVFEEGQRRDLAWSASSWPYGFPIEEVLQELNRLKAEGWRLLQVSEDRGLYAGQDAQTESGVVTARYLLTRE